MPILAARPALAEAVYVAAKKVRDPIALAILAARWARRNSTDPFTAKSEPSSVFDQRFATPQLALHILMPAREDVSIDCE